MSHFNTYSLRVPSERSCITMVEPFLRSVDELQSLGPSRFHDMHVAVTEAVNNAIIHAHHCIADIQVHVDIQISPHEIIVVVRDFGSGFDAESVPDPRLPENLLSEGGRGVFLIRHLADVVEFRRADPGMTVMIKYFR